MPERLLKVAVVGAGMIANDAHIPAWKKLAEAVEVVGVTSRSWQSAEGTAQRHNIPHVYTDLAQMLREVQPDIVSVCSPNVYHKDQSIAALKAGAHVMCEKPIAVRHKDAQEMYAAAGASGRLLSVSQTMRFSNEMAAAKEVADAGRLGEVYYAELSAIRRRGIPKWGSFHRKVDNAGGPLYDLGVHVLDALFWLTGNPRVKAVSGATYRVFGNQDEGLRTSVAESGGTGSRPTQSFDHREFDVEDFATGYIRLENGGTVLLRTSWAVNLPDQFGLSIAGTKAGMLLPKLTILENDGHYPAEVQLKVPENSNLAFSGHYRAAENFVAAIHGREELVVKEDEVLNVIRTIEALYQSAELGREVSLA